MPDLIEGISYVHCTNGNCISKKEHQEHVTPRFIKAGDGLLRCHYCDNIMKGDELF